MRFRHFLLLLSLLAFVAAPTLGAGLYLYTIAKDQYASVVGFSVRSFETSGAMELLGGISELSGTNSDDSDILNEYLKSQKMVRSITDKLDMAGHYQVSGDPFFSLGDDTRIEALTAYWNRMVKVYYDTSSGLIEVRVLAFDPEFAHQIATLVTQESNRLVNHLSQVAREDAKRNALEELDFAKERLKLARQEKLNFQHRTQIVDPSADIQGQMGLLNSLNSQLATAEIELALLLDSTSSSDPRVTQAQRKISAVQNLIEQERRKISAPTDAGSGAAYADLLAQFESLEVELQFAQQSYLSAQASYDAAIAEAQRQSRYLAIHIEPTLAETAEYPRRHIILLTLFGLLMMAWSIGTLVFYALRDRR